ncbi:MAG: arsenate reductase ArsC [Chloroflexi bacterium]|nr:arsenate reductase ArsC [Chloroflexota bacterium]MBI4198627.1 arsenate reductase ArsC [Chloroflexota bacterium]
MSDILFVCVHNAGRSQMARALFNREAQRLGLPYHADSAGTEPSGGVHAVVAQAMGELGMDIANERPKLITNEMVQQASRVVTMGCQVDADKCPAVFIRGVEDWGLPDPKDRPLAEVRLIRDTIQRRVAELLAELVKTRARP